MGKKNKKIPSKAEELQESELEEVVGGAGVSRLTNSVMMGCYLTGDLYHLNAAGNSAYEKMSPTQKKNWDTFSKEYGNFLNAKGKDAQNTAKTNARAALKNYFSDQF